MLKIGSHVSFSGKGLLNAATEAISYGSTSFMIYTGAPQNTTRKPIEEQFVPEGQQLMKEHGIDEIVVHAPYIINLGSYKNNTFRLAVDFLQAEIHRTEYVGVKQIVLHPGAYTDKDAEYGIERIAEGLNEVLSGTSNTSVNIALETMAGKGTEIGRGFEEIAQIIDKVGDNDRLSVCLDTCHIHDAGYDVVQGFDDVLNQFDKIVGIDRIAVLHLNDSKNPKGAGKDRHTPVGSGYIGFEAMNYIANHDSLKHLPMILETPWIGKDAKKQRPMYEVEIALLRGELQQRFGDEFMEHLEMLQFFFNKKEIEHRSFILNTWEVLKSDAKARKADPREPMERLYDMVVEERLFPELTEEQINHRLTAWFSL